MPIGTIWWCFFAVLNQMANLENFIYNIKPNDTILRYLVDITMWVVSSFIFFKKSLLKTKKSAFQFVYKQWIVALSLMYTLKIKSSSK
jgi:hypothetical protein